MGAINNFAANAPVHARRVLPTKLTDVVVVDCLNNKSNMTEAEKEATEEDTVLFVDEKYLKAAAQQPDTPPLTSTPPSEREDVTTSSVGTGSSSSSSSDSDAEEIIPNGTEAKQDPSVPDGVRYSPRDQPSASFVTEEYDEKSLLLRKTTPNEECPKECPQFINAPVLFALLSAICSSLALTGTKMVTNPALSPGSHIHPALLLCIRGAVGVPLTLLRATWWEGNEYPLGTAEQFPLLLTTGFFALGSAASVFAIQFWGSASVACIVNASPALTVLFAGLICSCCPDMYEPLELQSCCMLGLALIGIFFVSRPAMSSEVADDAGVGPLLAVLQCVMNAIMALVCRKIPGKPSAASITLYGQTGMLILGIALVVYDIVHLNKHFFLNMAAPAVPIAGMILVALGGNGSDYFRNMALRESKSVLVISMRFAVAPCCFLADLIMMLAAPNAHTSVSDGWSYVGCATIVIAGTMLLIIKHEKEQKLQEERRHQMDSFLDADKTLSEPILTDRSISSQASYDTYMQAREV